MSVTSRFLDTSYLVRYLTNDPPEMAEQAARIIESEEPLVLSEVALAETAYVLIAVYGTARDRLVDALLEVVQLRNIQMANLSKPIALEALRLCRGSKRVSFADALLWAQARERGVDAVYSFDRRFPSDGVKIIGMPPPTPPARTSSGH
ncbi:MAG TPA: type II toxin-antitoxin system VapC family toxin [Thermoanaerobaculia bacterium]|nr:type II toxin-antitoxin system VapC family toxin [Thermoanaerobaculia bacterium]